MIDHAIELKPRLLVLTTTYPRWDNDTWPTFVHELSSRLTSEYQVTVLAPRQPGAAETECRDNVQVKRFSYMPRPLELLSGNDGILQALRTKPWLAFLLPMFFIGMILAIRKQVQEGVDVIHAHWLPWAFLATLASSNTPVLATAHGSDVFKLRGSLWAFFRRMTAHRVKCIAAVSQSLADRLKEEGLHPERIVVAPMGVDLKNLFSSTSTNSDRPRDFLFVGRLIDAKGPDLLVDAMRVLHQKLPMSKLLIVGDGPLRHVLETKIIDASLDGVIELFGALPNHKIAELLTNSKVCVMPGRASEDGASEGLGLVAIEALGTGCRLVSGLNPALQGMLPATAPVNFVDAGKVEKLAAALVDATKQSQPSKEPGFSDFRRQLVERFDWDAVARNYIGILQKIIR